jgi:hypothetical protein
MPFLIRMCRALILLFCPLTLWAHEFWIAPVAAAPGGGSIPISLLVGEFFKGDLVGLSRAQTSAFRQYTAAGRKDLEALLPAAPMAVFPMRPEPPGTRLLVFDSQPSRITLPAGTFHAYLHDEGLDFIKARREAEGAAELPGRERYRRFTKSLFASSDAVTPGRADMTYATLAGQRLELIPMADPLKMSPGADLGMRVLFEGHPLAGALLKAWHKRDGQTLVIRATTATDGTAVFTLPYAGPWMISVVHMIPATDAKNIDWDSLWGSLTFVMPQAAPNR